MEGYVYYLYSDSTYYPGDLHFCTDINNYKGFSSLYAVTEETAEALKREGTVAGYAGSVWSERLWLDIDSYEMAESVELKLKEMGLDYIAYDSGGKGAHFGILRDHPPSHLLPKKDRAWVASNFPQADLSIYTPLHLFRLPSTVHEKTGRQKTLAGVCKGRTLNLPALQTGVLRSLQSMGHARNEKESVFKDGRLMYNIKQARVGERHATLVKVAYALKDKETDPNIARWFLNEVNKLFAEEKDPEQIDKVVANIFSKPY